MNRYMNLSIHSETFISCPSALLLEIHKSFCALSTLFSLLKTTFGADRASSFGKIGRYSSCLGGNGFEKWWKEKTHHSHILQNSEVWRALGLGPNPQTSLAIRISECLARVRRDASTCRKNRKSWMKHGMKIGIHGPKTQKLK